MNLIATILALSALLFLASIAHADNGVKPQVLDVWPGVAPGEKGDRGEEHDQAKHDPKAAPRTEVILLTNVSKPTIAVYRPAKPNGAAVVVCPGGGYQILAMDLEGTEVCEWLNSLGVTAFLLKYRVPGRLSDTYRAPLQDVQRTLSLVRSRAEEFKIDPKRVGVIGFSAGAHLSASASTLGDSRSYKPVDKADELNCRPDFAMLIYPAYLADDANLSKTAPDIHVTATTSPAFIVQTQDDPVKVECAYTYGLALKNAGVPVEAHIYTKGGHGYGLRLKEGTISHWPQQAAEWLKDQGWLNASQ